MNNLVGHSIYRCNLGCFAVEGTIGSAYNFIMTGNGLAIQAENNHIWARFIIAPAEVRGLPKINECSFKIKHGRIPQRFWDLALSVFLASPEVERYAGIRWDGQGYALYISPQDGKAASLSYDCGQDIVFEMHSHPGMKPFFSGTDDKDEQGMKVYGVLGYTLKDYSHLNGGLPVTQWEPLINLRIGVYGYFHPVKWSDIFEGVPGDVIDVSESGEAN